MPEGKKLRFAMDLGERIKEAADEIGGLLELAKAVETARRTVGNWVSGATEPQSSQLAQIALRTGVSIKWLVLGLGPKFENSLFEMQTAGRDSQSTSEPDLMVQDANGMRMIIEAKNFAGPIRSDALVEMHKLIKKIHSEAGIRLQDTDVLVMASTAYNDFVADEVDFTDLDEVNARMVLLQKRLQKQIASAKAEPGTGKRSAS